MTAAKWLIPLGLLAASCAHGAGPNGTAPVQDADGAAAAGTQQARFDILDFQIDGNTVLDVETVEKAVYPHLGPGKGIDDVELARQTLEGAYRQAGYPTVVVSIPEQDVEGGRVRLEITEGSVEYLHITGSRYYALGKIREGVPALAAGQVPHMPTVQKQINALAQESVDRQLTPIFRAGSTPGKMEVELKIADQLPLHGSVEVNGRNTENTTRTRVIGSIRYDNLWQKFHSASLQYQVSAESPDEVDVWSGTYVMPTGWADTRLAFYGIGISSSTQLGASVGGTAVVGAGSIYGLRLLKPLPERESYLHSLSLGFDYKSFDQAVSVAGQDLTSTPIAYAPFTIGYDGTWRMEEFVSSLSLAAHFSVRGLGNDAQEFEDRRYKARPNYFYFSADLKHQQKLPVDFRLLVRASAQAAESPLISNEQFALGGSQSVRGYHQTQQLGDDGLNLSLELQSPKHTPDAWEAVQNLRLLVFVDWGYLWVLDPLPGNPGAYRLASAGMGLRMQILKHFVGEFDWGYPFYRQGTVDPGQQRVDFRMAYEF
ncbi:ShlB/FhaC/HecB family hemolysin secretion/activation protein [Methylococcus sp. EFPC2]|uniref:ShlB/FhaC/HecB family hemolysin secretion/activation protein n=1 Tax=Methylococcus sp. EFPC2 TaxID=2812648 RepID=UPI001F0806A0|nr:ShlB/FhaC/HecB family hemolysin secretion/activation protein [Methylococcus sp. EFPC2]